MTYKPVLGGEAFDLCDFLRRWRSISTTADELGEPTPGPRIPRPGELTPAPGTLRQGHIFHAREVLADAELHPTDILNWINLALLALDAALRTDHAPEEIASAFEYKLSMVVKKVPHH